MLHDILTCAATFSVSALNKVLFPTFGRPERFFIVIFSAVSSS